MSRLDTWIRNVFPGWAVRREQARDELQRRKIREEVWPLAKEALEERRAERSMRLSLGRSSGASTNRGGHEQFAGTVGTSADFDILDELETLRTRSRDLERSEPYAAGLLSNITDSTIGMGLRPRPNLPRTYLESQGVNADLIESVEQALTHEWESFACKADAHDRCTWAELCWLALHSMLTDGESFWHIVHLPDSGRPYSLAIEAIDADRIDTPWSMVRDGKDIRLGVELGSMGQPVRYWVEKQHPNDWTRAKTRLAREFIGVQRYSDDGRLQMAHSYHVTRPGQTRGVPLLRPVISYFADLAGYLEAEIEAARVAACVTLFVTKQDPNAALNSHLAATNADNERLIEMRPGQVWYGNMGESVEAVNPSRPTGAFESFVERIMRGIAFAIGVPYEVMDVSNANYSSARMALGEAMKSYRRHRSRFISASAQPVYQQFVEEAYLQGKLGDFDFYADPMAWSRCTWIVAGGVPHVDPEKEANALEKQIELGLMSREQAAAHFGNDYSETLHALKAEKELREELGLESAPMAPATVPPSGEDEDTEDDDDGTEPTE